MTEPNLFDAAVKPPTISKQCNTVLGTLKFRGGWISAWDIIHQSFVLCYTKRISELRRAGYVIEMRWHVDSYGKKDYTEYRLVSEPSR